MAISLTKMTVPLATDQSATSQGLLMPKLQYRFRVSFLNFGVDNILITSGIHKDLFKYSIKKGLKDIENWRKKFKPTYVCENFSF